ncbi:alpha-galactosidase [Streptococcus iniae]|uniref:alpha-galactosidase n=1 Tax=Streptococcus iniae TaxID=1346 RepID=UPI002B2FC632|nr:alpha-galactosidase [Streptococcus iniae]
MPIHINQEKQEFHLYNDDISYIVAILPNGQVGHHYFGKRVHLEDSFAYLQERDYRSLTVYPSESDPTFSLQHTRQEYPSFGTGDFANPAFTIKAVDGGNLSEFIYKGHQLQKGKPVLDGLPSTYVESDEEATTLILHLEDQVTKTKLDLVYSIYENRPVIARHVRFEQIGKQAISIERLMSASLDFQDSDYDWIHLDGAWGRERHLVRSPLRQGCQSIYSLKGTSSSEHNPFVAIVRPHTTEHQGQAMGFSLVYSGNFLARLDLSPYQQARLTMGIHPEGFEWLLQEGESLTSPELVMVYSDQGLNGMSQTFHCLYGERLVRGPWRDKERPILLNNWEAMTFDFDENRIVSLAKEATRLGVELFVMDDGWFGKRNNDRAGLGDWTVNVEKLPKGLTGVIDAVHGMGMKFGLWIEPEMVNKDSDLFREHPDWIFHHPTRNQSHGRFQYTLNMAHEEVYQNIYQQIHKLLSEHAIDYIKWDMNRYMAEVYSVFHVTDQQGKLYHQYILNIYRLYEALTSAFPEILFESCSSGGARFDPGMLYYAPQTWTSDNSDALERMTIQYGTSFVYPLSSMGCHVSESPNQQVGRCTPLATRANVAYFGSFGYELDLTLLNQAEKKAIAKQIDFYKANRVIFQKGLFTRLVSPFETNYLAWQVLSADGKKGFIAFYRQLIACNEVSYRLYLKGLDQDAKYLINGGGYYYGSSLMHAGLVIAKTDFEDGLKDFSSLLISIEKVD